jgi:Flp pilus assembly protein TadG
VRQSSSNRWRRGATTLEFGLILGSLLLFILGVVEFSRFLATRAAFHSAIAEVARRALVTPSMRGDNAAAKTYALDSGILLRADALSITMTPPVTGGTTFTVAGTYTFSFVIPIFGSGTRTFSATVVHAL